MVLIVVKDVSQGLFLCTGTKYVETNCLKKNIWHLKMIENET